MANSQVSAVDSSERVWLFFAVPLTTVLVLIMARPGISIDWFFDEAWRADMVRSFGFNRYFLNNGPLPPGWVFVHQLIFSVLPSSRELIRLVAVAPAIIAWLMIGLMLRRQLTPKIGTTGAGVVGLGTVLLAILQPAHAHLVSYFNNYSLETLFTALLLWVGIHDDARKSARLFVVLAACGPWFVQSPLMLLLVVAVVLWRRIEPADRWLIMTGLGALAVSAVVTYVVFLRPVSKRQIPGLGTLSGYWEGQTFGAAGLIGSVKLVLRTLMFETLPVRWEWSILGWLVIGVGGLVGLRVMWSVWRWWVIAIPVTQLQILFASLALGWPISFVRVNHAVGLLITVLIPLGMMMAIWWIAQQLGSVTVVVSAIAVILVGIAMWPSALRMAAGGTGVFARGLSDDMDLLVPQLSEGDVVLGYHPMSSWYLHDRLVNESSVPVVLLDELEYGLFTDGVPGQLIADYAPDTTSVWCVLPWELGDLIAQRCQLSNEWELVDTQVLSRAEVRQWQRVGNS